MRIRELNLRPFRNLAAIRLSFAANYALVFGPNGRGKSNILEAISYLSIGKSVRGAKDPQAVPHGGEFFDIQATCTDGRYDRTLRIFYGKKEGKKATVDSSTLPRVSDCSFFTGRRIVGIALSGSAKTATRHTYFAIQCGLFARFTTVSTRIGPKEPFAARSKKIE